MSEPTSVYELNVDVLVKLWDDLFAARHTVSCCKQRLPGEFCKNILGEVENNIAAVIERINEALHDRQRDS